MNEQKEEYTIPPEFSEPKEHPANKRRLIVILVTGLFLIVCAVAYYMYVNSTEVMTVTQNQDTNEEPLRVEREWNPEGSIFLTLSPKDDRSVGIYEYNLSEKKLQRYLAPTDKIILTSKYVDQSPTKMLVAAMEQENMQIYQIENWKATQLTNTEVQLKRHPSWSGSHKLLVYGGVEDSSQIVAATLKPDDYSVYTYDVENKIEKKLTEGSFPSITPDGNSVIVLKNDGLYKVDFETANSEKIWGYDGDTEGTMQHHFGLSPKGKYIAWTHQASGKIYVMEVTSWAPFSGYVKYQLDTTAFWPVFSPNEEFLAFEEMDWIDPPANPRLVIIDLVSLERREVQDLDAYKQMTMFVTDWK